MAEGRIGANTQQSIETIVLLDSGETKLHFQTSCSAIVYACASACGECRGSQSRSPCLTSAHND